MEQVRSGWVSWPCSYRHPMRSAALRSAREHRSPLEGPSMVGSLHFQRLTMRQLKAGGSLTGDVEEELTSTPGMSAAAGRRFVDLLKPNVVNILTALGFGLPILGYFWVIYHFGINVITNDQFGNVTVVQDSYSHHFQWSVLWAQNNNDRLFFPDLLVILQSRTDHLNIQAEEYLNAIMLAAATALFIWAHKRRSSSTPWLYYCPVAFLTLSLVQSSSTLWGYSMCWYLIVFSLAVTLVLLDRIKLTWLALVGAIAAGVVGSYSSSEGLIIWPVGLILLYLRRRSPRFLIVWSLAAIATLLLFLHNFNLAGPPHPSLWASIRFYLFAVGDVLGFQPGLHDNFSPGLSDAVLVFGLVIVILGVGAVVVQLIRRPNEGGGPVGIALICFGLLFAGLIADGRAIFGFGGASQSRYTNFDLLIVVGIYLTLLGQPSLANRRGHVEAPTAETVAGNSRRSARQGPIGSGRCDRLHWPAGSLSR